MAISGDHKRSTEVEADMLSIWNDHCHVAMLESVSKCGLVSGVHVQAHSKVVGVLQCPDMRNLQGVWGMETKERLTLLQNCSLKFMCLTSTCVQHIYTHTHTYTEALIGHFCRPAYASKAGQKGNHSSKSRTISTDGLLNQKG